MLRKTSVVSQIPDVMPPAEHDHAGPLPIHPRLDIAWTIYLRILTRHLYQLYEKEKAGVT